MNFLFCQPFTAGKKKGGNAPLILLYTVSEIIG